RYAAGTARATTVNRRQRENPAAEGRSGRLRAARHARTSPGRQPDGPVRRTNAIRAADVRTRLPYRPALTSAVPAVSGSGRNGGGSCEHRTDVATGGVCKDRRTH